VAKETNANRSSTSVHACDAVITMLICKTTCCQRVYYSYTWLSTLCNEDWWRQLSSAVRGGGTAWRRSACCQSVDALHGTCTAVLSHAGCSRCVSWCRLVAVCHMQAAAAVCHGVDWLQFVTCRLPCRLQPLCVMVSTGCSRWTGW